MKLQKLLLTTVAFSVLMSSVAFAGTWQTGAGANQGKWWYDNGNGAYTSNGWQWIDGNNDGVAESYYFDEAGWLLVNTTTPDGYAVNADGAWVENGIVQTKSVNVEATPISESDFVVGGNNSITQNNADNSIITNWNRLGYSDVEIFHCFVSGDSLVTARGVALGESKNTVISKYGNKEAASYNTAADKWYGYIAGNGFTEASTISTAASVLEYTSNPYGIRFYFNQQEQLIGVVYYRDLTTFQNSNAATNVDGLYNYYKSEFYVKNEQTGTYELFKETKNFDKMVDYNIYENEVWYERSGIGLVADIAYIEYSIKTVGTNDIIFETESEYEPVWHFAFQGKEYIPTYYELNGENYAADLSNSDTLECDGNTLAFISKAQVREESVWDELFGLGGRDIMWKEIYKKK